MESNNNIVRQDATSTPSPNAATVRERRRRFTPELNIRETDTGFVVAMDMPGVTRDQVEISIEHDTLHVEGRVTTDAYEGLRPVYIEYPVGDYTRQLSLSDDIDRDSIRAEMADGVLTLTLPKKPHVLPRRITVH